MFEERYSSNALVGRKAASDNLWPTYALRVKSQRCVVASEVIDDLRAAAINVFRDYC